MNWKGPYTINRLLGSLLEPPNLRPPEAHGVYLISQKSWENQPAKDCIPLYVGSNTGTTERFRIRIGDLIADMFGFFGSEKGHHSGGRSLHNYCRGKHMNPKKLYIAWTSDFPCERCSENAVYDRLKPSLNKKRPARCKRH
jgi:hypothetical protein